MTVGARPPSRITSAESRGGTHLALWAHSGQHEAGEQIVRGG